MTPPPPITFAGKGSTAGHTRQVRRKPAPAAPRRVSGPVRGRTAAPAKPRRVSGPAVRQPGVRQPGVRQPGVRQPGVRRPAARRAPARPLGARALAYIRALPDHRLIDRLIHSRAWIPVLGVLLSGIVFMQVEVLKLNANMGRAIQASSALQSRNELLRNAVSALSDDQRIESLAAKNGMVMPAPDAPSFLGSHSGTAVGAALANIHTPDPAAFAASLPPPPVSPASGATPVTSATPGTISPVATSVTPAVPAASSGG